MIKFNQFLDTYLTMRLEKHGLTIVLKVLFVRCAHLVDLSLRSTTFARTPIDSVATRNVLEDCSATAL